nr:hypothetical protein [Tanacetum cinerariifolium]
MASFNRLSFLMGHALADIAVAWSWWLWRDDGDGGDVGEEMMKMGMHGGGDDVRLVVVDGDDDGALVVEIQWRLSYDCGRGDDVGIVEMVYRIWWIEVLSLRTISLVVPLIPTFMAKSVALVAFGSTWTIMVIVAFRTQRLKSAVMFLLPMPCSTSTFITGASSLILSSSRCLAILDYVANLPAIFALYSARPTMVRFALVA